MPMCRRTGLQPFSIASPEHLDFELPKKQQQQHTKEMISTHCLQQRWNIDNNNYKQKENLQFISFFISFEMLFFWCRKKDEQLTSRLSDSRTRRNAINFWYMNVINIDWNEKHKNAFRGSVPRCSSQLTRSDWFCRWLLLRKKKKSLTPSNSSRNWTSCCGANLDKSMVCCVAIGKKHDATELKTRAICIVATTISTLWWHHFSMPKSSFDVDPPTT
jgi:hypothetical protein